jgi:hypothetical protein
MKPHAAVAVIVLLVFAGCAPQPDSSRGGSGARPLMDEEIAMAVKANRPVAGSEPSGKESVDDLLYPYTSFAGEDTISRITRSKERPPRFVSQEEAAEDVRFLFDMFKYGYCMYQAFGGDEAFGQARDRVLSGLPTIARHDGMVRVTALRGLVLQHIGFIQDGHASFANAKLYRRFNWFHNERVGLRKDESGWYTTTHVTRWLGLIPVYREGDRQYLVSVDGAPPEESVALSLSESGELRYNISLLKQVFARRIRVQVVFRDDAGRTEEQDIVLHRHTSEIAPDIDIEFRPKATPYRLTARNGIPIVIHQTSIPASGAAENLLSSFITSAAALRGSRAVVLDLRHHEGGQLEYPLRWTQTFMGAAFSHDDRYATLETRTSFRLYRFFAESYYAGNSTRLSEAMRYFDEKIASLDVHESPESAWVFRGEADSQPDLQANGTTLFVLIDSRTGSAGEGFVYLLRQFENVVFVGENTKGLMVSASPAWGTLPHSRLPFVLTVDVSLKDAREGLEGIGYKPDIWVDPGKALERVLQYMHSRP